jgi:ketosteroid isomerase-like protein
MSSLKAVVQTYFDGFRRSDHAAILACLTDDVVWELPGYKSLAGKKAFDGEIENDDFEGSPKLTVDRLIEEGNSVVALGAGQGARKAGGLVKFAFSTAFTFTGDKISRVESYVVPLT